MPTYRQCPNLNTNKNLGQFTSLIAEYKIHVATQITVYINKIYYYDFKNLL